MPNSVITITRRYRFSSAHWLPKVPETHKCHNMHGHNYKVDVTVGMPSGFVGGNGLVLDFFDLDAMVEPLIKMVDHKTLNDIDGLQNPSAELIALWFFGQVQHALYGRHQELYGIRVYEEDDCWSDCVWEV